MTDTSKSLAEYAAGRKVVIVEDDPDIQMLLKIHLAGLGLETVIAADGITGLEKAAAEDTVLVVLDIMLPELSGLEICRKLREIRPRLPILMLTGRAEEADKILGLELGADDYLTKPFSIGELVARIKALLRRAQMPEQAEKEAPMRQKIICGPLEIDIEQRRVALCGVSIELTHLEFELLLFLASNPGRPFTRKDLLYAVWKYIIKVTNIQ